jgi:selT/selW/selH-like putative selenoprotein
MKTRKDAAVTLRRGGGGVFEITVEGRLAYSKKSTGAFPTEAQVLAAVG